MQLFPFSSCLHRSHAEQTDVEKNQAMLFLNVYDLTPANNYLYWFGLGFYHSGIEVHGLEYAFGADVEPTTGVFEVEPRNCPGYVFRRSILLGSTDMSRSEICSFMDLISDQYQGNTYNLIYKNCNHFTDEVCHCLTGKRIPGWVNRLARIGSFIESVLPESAQTTPLRHFPESHFPESQMYSVDGSDSDASSATEESEMEDVDRHVLISSHGNVGLSDRPPMRLAKDRL
ncbi:deSI-like protein At4g17486 isoform X1 [Salvia miltiorrhiza]|uniref:deSI-like protein At4g17486 isoform X1 n=1 Tax=Salvia miltiorrhiza TaxID=226208 RepID=UPI0025AD3872|nr:deSI-like protein At4g17486 isoform X1 [Salvia miltiorrhiza]XP_057799628.1 deSI-like protein At4g17486 isoform X1 [Salvia miltiorrhiza]XP_057799637.1 deSI-like protein At4g17486 isoform X1 [Salvia miltiorrhiza]XP_057799644.1 deSI-like protein At4g17486 isoform X1 [Salvia miltiorrhiza]XP_057799653.1 deSI-like protein At4g17486 isoform X1 [Salvia miltiorrhiza]XP_057799657.1 deSI-like protein At4g17486 isoform X1 [Salvia miltiorrhiza]XP_057799661.1 deSI-like protein At4g17486 isoform X1 [Salv